MNKIFLAFLFLFNISLFAQISVTLPDTSLTSGSIEIPVYVSDLSGQDVISFQFNITFDSNILEATGIETNETVSSASGWSVIPNTNSTGKITVGAFGANPLTSGGVLVKLKFDIKSVQGTSPLDFSSFEFNGGTPSANTTSGSVIIGTIQNTLSVTPSNHSVSYLAGNTSFDISSNISWSVSASDSWIEVTPLNGNNDGLISISYSENNTPTQRVGTITISGSGKSKEVSIIQEGKPQINTIEVSIPDVSTSDSSIEIPINVDDLTGQSVISYQFKIEFNSNLIEATGVETNGTISSASGWSVVPNTNVPGEITVGAFGTNVLSGSGLLVKLKFDIKATQGTSPLNFSSFEFNSGTPEVNTTNGNVEIINNTLNPPILSSPTNGATNQELTLKLDWNSSTDATSYQVQVSRYSNFSSTVNDKANLSSTYYNVLTGKLNYSTKYYWRVKAKNSSTESEWSSIWDFTTKENYKTTSLINKIGEAKVYSAIGRNWLKKDVDYIKVNYGWQEPTGKGTFLASANSVGGVRKQSIYASPDFEGQKSATVAEYQFNIATNDRIETFYGLADGQTYNYGNVRFVIQIYDGNNYNTILNEIVKDSDNWHFFSYDLSNYKNKSITIRFITDPNGKTWEDWAHWGEPSLLRIVGVKEVKHKNSPTNFILSQNYPNPFNPTTQITYSIPKVSSVSINVFNSLGQKVATLVNAEKGAGTYSVTFDANTLTSGLYFYQITAGSYSETKKMLLIR